MLQFLSLPILSQCRDTAKLVCMYKVLHQVVDDSVPDSYFTHVSLNTRGHQSKFMQLQTNVDSYKYSFYQSTIRLWNTLPNHMIDSRCFSKLFVKLVNVSFCNLIFVHLHSVQSLAQ